MNIPSSENKRPLGLALFMVVAGAIGLTAAFALTVEKIHQLKFPEESASCDFGVVVQCGKNLASWQGSLLGFPNPLIGLMAWSVVMTLAISLLAGSGFAPWIWRGLTIGSAVAFAFVIWLFTQSVFVLGTLCPWCMVTWFATIPLFWVLTFWTMKQGVWGIKVQKLGSLLLSWVGIVILFSYLVEALIAQLALDWIGTL